VGERGQGSVEWIGVVFLVTVLLGGLLAAAGPRVPGGSVARAIAGRMVCAARLAERCRAESELDAAYGAELATLAREHAPRIRYERGMTALPVDFRRCREDACSTGSPSGSIWRSSAGEPVVAFVHVIDCRAPEIDRTRRAGADCSGPRADHLYIQYWFYYAGSATAEGRVLDEAIREVSTAVGEPSYHADDWESYQVRIGPAGTSARASSHHGYNYDGGAKNWLSDAGVVHRSSWGPSTGRTYVSDGSHAGHVHGSDGPVTRWTPASRLQLVPIESLDPGERQTPFAVTPPWRKDVYRDPESQGT
jgi:type II secretory pathway pseudopilin PulG